MGIQGLIPLKSIKNLVEISKYANQTVVVDGHCWLRRGTLDCAFKIYRGEETNTYVEYFMNLVQILLSYKIVPIIVFDGQQLPIKRAAADASATFRSVKLEEGKALLNKGKIAEANKCFRQAISITPYMVDKVIKELDRHKIQHIVSPYEAAPQLTYMVNSGQVKAVITDRLDVMAFGCFNVIYKMNCSGKGIPITCKDICNQVTGTINPRKLRYMCILSGCDYLPSLPGIGLQDAQDIVKECRTIKNILQFIKNQFTEEIANEYGEKFIKANAAFLYQFVFDPTSRTYARFSPLPNDIKVDYLSGLGESPQNQNIPLLKSNNAIYLNYARILKESNKENIDPFVQLVPFEFNEFEFDENVLKDIEILLKRVEPRFRPTPTPTKAPTPTSTPRRRPLTCITNTDRLVILSSSLATSQSRQKRKSSLVDCHEPAIKVSKPFVLADTSVVRQAIR